MSSSRPDAALPLEVPLVTAAAEHGRRVVASLDAAAARAGLRPGMTITRARMLAPELVAVDADPEGDADALRRLALWAGRRYAPFVAPDPPDGLWIDISGCEALFGGERALLKDLHRRIAASGHVVQIACADTPGCAHAVGTGVPTRDAAHMVKLLMPRIEKIDAGLGIEAMTLVAPLVEPLVAAQVDFAPAGERAPDLVGLVDTLANRFGARRLYRLGARPSAMPERGVASLAPLGREVSAPFAADLPRPARLLSPPEPIAVTAMLPDHPPAMFVWRRSRHRVVAADGPERLHGEWWREAGHEAETPFMVRDYFQVEVEGGGRYWIFRLGDGEWPASGPMQWFLHGAFA